MNKGTVRGGGVHLKPQGQAFTLAEVLITLGIIGIVAAITIPTLISNYQDRDTVVKFQKVYSVLSQALLLSVNEYGTPDRWGYHVYSETEDSDPVNRTDVKPLIEQLKVIKDCGYDGKGCFPYRYERLNGGDNERDFENLSRYYKVILADGTSMAIQGSDTINDEKTCREGGFCIEVWFDVNGPKGPNVIGRDMFLTSLARDKILDVDNKHRDDLFHFCGLDGNPDNRGYNCTDWVYRNKNLDYLHCNDLNWKTKTKCK